MLVGAILVGFARARTASVSPVSYIIGATATANEPAPVLSSAILQSLRSAGLGRVPATAYVVTPGAGQPDSLPLTPYLSNGQVDYGPTRNMVPAGQYLRSPARSRERGRPGPARPARHARRGQSRLPRPRPR